MDYIAIVVVLGLVVLVVSGPLRARATRRDVEEESARAELEAAREAKYREIREAELDHRTGKLSEADWRAQDRRLRAEAVDILRRLDELAHVPGARADEGGDPPLESRP